MSDLKLLLIDPLIEKGGQEKFILNLNKFFLKKNYQSHIPKIYNKSLFLIFYNEIYKCRDKFKSFKIINNSDRTYLKVLIYSILFKLFVRKLIVYHIHHINFFDLKKYNTISNIKFYILYFTFIIADFLSLKRIFVNSEMKKFFKKNNYLFIDNGINTNIPKINNDNFHYLIKQKICRFVFIGRLSIQKNLVNLIYALKKLDKVDYIFDIYGDGPLNIKIQKLIKYLKLEKKIFLKGKIDDPKLILRKYHCLLQPSLFEGLSLSMLEANLFDLYIIATKDSLIPQKILEQKKIAIISDASVNQIYKSIKKFIDNKNIKYQPYNKSFLFDEKKTYKNYEKIINGQ